MNFTNRLWRLNIGFPKIEFSTCTYFANRREKKLSECFASRIKLNFRCFDVKNMWSNVFEIERFLVIYTEQYKRCQTEIPNKNSNSLIFRSVALFRQMSPFHFAHEFYRDLCTQKLSTRMKKKSALQNWYKFKCQKVGNFCVDICNCLRIIAKLK